MRMIGPRKGIALGEFRPFFAVMGRREGRPRDVEKAPGSFRRKRFHDAPNQLRIMGTELLTTLQAARAQGRARRMVRSLAWLLVRHTDHLECAEPLRIGRP